MGDRLDKDISSMKTNKVLISKKHRTLVKQGKERKTNRKPNKGYCGNMSCKLQNALIKNVTLVKIVV